MMMVKVEKLFNMLYFPVSIGISYHNMVIGSSAPAQSINRP